MPDENIEDQKRNIRKLLGYDPDDPEISVQIIEGRPVTGTETFAELKLAIKDAMKALLKVHDLIN